MGEEDVQHLDQGEEQEEKEDTTIRIQTVIFQGAKDPGTKGEEGGPVDWGQGRRLLPDYCCVNVFFL